MPELPEVETIRRGLVLHASGQEVLRVSGRDSRLFRDNPAGIESIRDLLEGCRIEGFDRRGKFMWLLAQGQSSSLMIHLGMSGQVRFETADSGELPRPKHEHLRLEFERGSLSFVDPRMFGRLTVSGLEQRGSRAIPQALAHIAMDPLEPDWDPVPVIQRARRSRRKIKTILLDQQLLSGVGNIYADEALFRARLHGSIRGDELPVELWTDLLEASAAAMRDAIEEGGTSFDSLYVNVEGNPGYFGNSLAVYGRANHPCLRCNTPIERVVLEGRSHFYCRHCQNR